jgi:hypothetical protein
MERELRKKAKFWFLFLLGILISAPIITALMSAQLFLYAIVYLVFFLFSVNVLYLRVYKRIRPKYPQVPPDGKPDVYYGSSIPRPIYEDVQRYPWFFKKKHKKSKKKKS